MDGATSSNSLLWLVGAVFILIGLIFVPVAIKKVRADLASQNWPHAMAMLQRAEVMKYVVDRMHKDEGPTQRTSYSALLTYGYQVKGRAFTAQHGEPADDASHAARLVAGHNIGEMRAIHHDPQQPEIYRVELGAGFSGLLWLLPTLAFGGFGALIIWVGS